MDFLPTQISSFGRLNFSSKLVFLILFSKLVWAKKNQKFAFWYSLTIICKHGKIFFQNSNISDFLGIKSETNQSEGWMIFTSETLIAYTYIVKVIFNRSLKAKENLKIKTAIDYIHKKFQHMFNQYGVIICIGLTKRKVLVHSLWFLSPLWAFICNAYLVVDFGL